MTTETVGVEIQLPELRTLDEDGDLPFDSTTFWSRLGWDGRHSAWLTT